MNPGASIETLAKELSRLRGALEDGEDSTAPNFWHHRPQEEFPPRAIRSPEDYAGGDRLAIACTQTNLPAKQQKELVRRWCEALPTFHNVRYVWFQSKTTQELFDAACAIPQLEGLYVKWSSIEDLSALTSADRLRSVHLGSSASVASIEPLASLRQLARLDLDNLKKIRSLAPLANLTGLTALTFTGAEFKRNTIESFEPLGSLRNLAWLHVGALRTDDASLKPLASLKKLEFLALGNFFSAEEFACLAAQLPTTKCNWLQPFARFHKSVFPCPQCKQNWRVMTSGKPAKLLCPTCDAMRLAKHVRLFERLKAEATA